MRSGGTGLGPVPCRMGSSRCSAEARSPTIHRAGAGDRSRTLFRGVGIAGVVPNRSAGRTVVRYAAADGAGSGRDRRYRSRVATLRGSRSGRVHGVRRDERVRRTGSQPEHRRASCPEAWTRSVRARATDPPGRRPSVAPRIQDRRDRSNDRQNDGSNHIDDRLERVGDGGDDRGDGVDDRPEWLGDSADDGGDCVDYPLQRLGDGRDRAGRSRRWQGLSGSVTAGMSGTTASMTGFSGGSVTTGMSGEGGGAIASVTMSTIGSSGSVTTGM